MDADPYPNPQNPKCPVYDPGSLGFDHPDPLPRGYLAVTRWTQRVEDKESFAKITLSSTVSVLRGLRGISLIVQELQFKLKQDIASGTLVKLSDFLQTPDIGHARIKEGKVS